MARKLQRFALSKKTNAGFCLGAIFMPILSSILTVSCGVYYNTDTERKFEESVSNSLTLNYMKVKLIKF
nr:hypothetical protein [Mycoplasmopsis bovis]